MDVIFDDDDIPCLVEVMVVVSKLDDADDANDGLPEDYELDVVQFEVVFLVELKLAHVLLSCVAEDFRQKEKLFYIQHI